MPHCATLFAVIAMVVSGAAVAPKAFASDCTGVETSGPAVDDIRALEQKGADSNVHTQSRTAAEAMFAPGFVSIDQNGNARTREQILQTYKGGKSVAWADSFRLSGVNVKIFCDAAIVMGAAEAHPLSAPTAVVLRFRYLNVWTHAGGTWRLIATQFSFVQPSTSRGNKCSASCCYL
jgi:hypothetical protein